MATCDAEANAGFEACVRVATDCENNLSVDGGTADAGTDGGTADGGTDGGTPF